MTGVVLSVLLYIAVPAVVGALVGCLAGCRCRRAGDPGEHPGDPERTRVFQWWEGSDMRYDRGSDMGGEGRHR